MIKEFWVPVVEAVASIPATMDLPQPASTPRASTAHKLDLATVAASADGA